MKTLTKSWIPFLLTIPMALAAQPAEEVSPFREDAAASGLGINLPLVARLIGAGATLYTSSVDVANNTASATQVDFYLDGIDIATGASLSRVGSISSSGTLVGQGAGQMRGRSNAHFDDFVQSLIDAGILPANVANDGFIGSALFVFNGRNKSGQGEAKVRFFSSFGGGTIGQALRGHEITSGEPQALVASFRDSRGEAGPQLYANMFLNNIGLTPTGALASGAVTVHIQAYSSSTGQAVGAPKDTIIGLGQTVGVTDVLHTLAVPAGNDAVLVVVTVTSGNAAIAGVQAQVDEGTRDGSVMDMGRADFGF